MMQRESTDVFLYWSHLVGVGELERVLADSENAGQEASVRHNIPG